MYSVIVVPPACGSVNDQVRIATGERLSFGRAASEGGLTIAHEGVPRVAGEITAHRSFWMLSNLSENQTYLTSSPS